MDDTQAALSDLCDALAHPDNVLNVATSHAYRSAIAALAASREKACEQAPVYIEGVNVERLQRACTQQGISIEGSREALIAPSAMADAINSLTQSVVSASNYVHHSRCPAPAGEPEDVLATYNRTDGRREWVNLGTWLRRGEEIVQRSIAAPATVGEPVAWMTRTDEGDPAMLFFDRAEAVQYCDDGEQPTPLYEACHAGTPSGWLVVRQDGKDRFVTQSEECANGFVGSGWSKSPLYDQAALDAAVAAERARLAQDVADLHMAQSVNNQNYHADWHDGVDAALAVIRGA